MNRFNGDSGVGAEKGVDAFAQIYAEYRRVVYATCLAILKDPDLAEDAVHDTFLKAFLSLERFKDGKQIKPWLNSIARRRCIDLLRHQVRRVKDSSFDDVKANGKALHLNGQDPFSDATFQEVINVEQMAKLRHALASLAPRQRRVLLLSVLEGWSNADIASADEISLGAVSLLLVRARQKLRDTWEKLGALTPSWPSLRERLDAAIDRMQKTFLYSDSDRWAAFGAHALLAGSLALCVCLLVQPGPPASAGELPSAPSLSNESLVETIQASGIAGKVSPATAGSNQSPGGASGTTPPQTPAAGSGLDNFFEPTPETTRFDSIEPSPNYAQDHTVFAAGRPSNSYSPYGLFVSRDGGASWERLPALGLNGSVVLLPPNYPQDPRIFAMGDQGLQESVDGGNSFMPVSLVRGQAAVSPGYASGDRRVIIRSTTGATDAQLQGLFEYLVDQRQTRPLRLGITDGISSYAAMALSPRFPLDPTILLAKSRSGSYGLYRCSDDGCEDSVSLEGYPLPLWIKFSPRFESDRAVYSMLVADGDNKLIRSVDMMRSYEYLITPKDYHGVAGMAISSAAGPAKMFLTGAGMTELIGKPQTNDGWPGYLLLSEDQGATWKTVTIGLPRWGTGAGVIAVTATGRVFVASIGYGLACSESGGYSWKARCLAEK